MATFHNAIFELKRDLEQLVIYASASGDIELQERVERIKKTVGLVTDTLYEINEVVEQPKSEFSIGPNVSGIF